MNDRFWRGGARNRGEMKDCCMEFIALIWASVGHPIDVGLFAETFVEGMRHFGELIDESAMHIEFPEEGYQLCEVLG